MLHLLRAWLQLATAWPMMNRALHSWALFRALFSPPVLHPKPSQVLLQKAKSEPLSDLSMLDVFKWLKQVKQDGS